MAEKIAEKDINKVKVRVKPNPKSSDYFNGASKDYLYTKHLFKENLFRYSKAKAEDLHSRLHGAFNLAKAFAESALSFIREPFVVDYLDGELLGYIFRSEIRDLLKLGSNKVAVELRQSSIHEANEIIGYYNEAQNLINVYGYQNDQAKTLTVQRLVYSTHAAMRNLQANIEDYREAMETFAETGRYVDPFEQ